MTPLPPQPVADWRSSERDFATAVREAAVAAMRKMDAHMESAVVREVRTRPLSEVRRIRVEYGVGSMEWTGDGLAVSGTRRVVVADHPTMTWRKALRIRALAELIYRRPDPAARWPRLVGWLAR